MIIRILGEGQYDVAVSLEKELNAIDNRIVDHVSKGMESEYSRELTRMISLVKGNGKALDPGIIVSSDLILPPADLTLDEARKVFKGEGLIKD
jgi:hypothetical protein